MGSGRAMTFIAVRTEAGSGWQFVEGQPYPDEAFLRDRLYEEPRLIPADDLGLNGEAGIVAAREVGLPGAGSSDVVLVDSDGEVVVVECKLATNPEKKRTVVGQVLDYASALASMSFENLNERFTASNGSTLVSAMRAAVGEPDWDESNFVDSVQSTLTKGSFRLVIAIDQMDPNLARILKYIEAQSRGHLRIFGLEMRYHQQEEVEVIVPAIGNPTSQAVQEKRERWTAERFRAEIALHDPKVTDALEDLLDYGVNNPDGLNWGTATDSGSFGYRMKIETYPYSLFVVYTDGTVQLYLDTMKKYLQPSAFAELVNSLVGIRGLEKLRDSTREWTQFQVRNVFVDVAARSAFKAAFDSLRGEVQGE